MAPATPTVQVANSISTSTLQAANISSSTQPQQQRVIIRNPNLTSSTVLSSQPMQQTLSKATPLQIPIGTNVSLANPSRQQPKVCCLRLS